MSYQVIEKLLDKYNRPRKGLTPLGFVVHSTATPGATAQAEFIYFNGADRQASAHYFVDWTEIIRTIPENEQAWHAGPTANRLYLSVEMCEPAGNDPAKFAEVWGRTVWLVADACVRYGWGTGPNVFSHRGISQMYGETNHTDPIDFFSSYGRTWEQFLSAIDAEIAELKKPGEGDDFEMENVVVYYTAKDFSTAQMIADMYGGCATFCRNGQAAVHADAKKAKRIFTVGGPALNLPGEIYMSGNTAFDTMAAVIAKLKGGI